MQRPQDLNTYDKVIIAFSGGKDSLACVLHCIDLGCDLDRLELWHHHIDGAPGSRTFMDWECTEDYCRKVAEQLGVTLRFSWRDGGFYREMMKKDSVSGGYSWESADGTIHHKPSASKPNTRRLFPQVSANLITRWCSGALKIDVGRVVMANEPKMKTGKFLFISGERREESANRAKYKEVEWHKCCTKKRRVTAWRPVIDWTEKQVWEIIERYKIVPHPAYRLGWGRLSCRACIFGNPDQWASVRDVSPEQFQEIADLEKTFGKTIHRTKSVVEQADAGTSSILDAPEDLRKQATDHDYSLAVVTDDWELPVGAFKECGGPT